MSYINTEDDNTITMLPGELIWNKALETTRLRLIFTIFAAGVATGIILTVATAIIVIDIISREL